MMDLCGAGSFAVEEAGNDEVEDIGDPHCHEWGSQAADGEG